MSMWTWIGLLAMLGFFALIFIPLNQIGEVNVINQTRGTLTNSTNVEAFDYGRTVWNFMPFIFLIALMFWAFNQAQKHPYG